MFVLPLSKLTTSVRFSAVDYLLWFEMADDRNVLWQSTGDLRVHKTLRNAKSAKI